MVYFANIVPLGEDDHFSTYSRAQVKKLLKAAEEQYKKATFQGQVVLQLGEDLWLNNIELIENLSNINTTVSLVNAKDELLQQRLAEYKEECLQKLLELCQNAGIEAKKPIYRNVTENKEVEKEQKKEQVVPQWAFLDETVDYNEVYFSSGNSPNEFYVRLKKFQKQ